MVPAERYQPRNNLIPSYLLPSYKKSCARYDARNQRMTLNDALFEEAIMPVRRHSVLLLKSQDPALVRTTSFFAMIDYQEVH